MVRPAYGRTKPGTVLKHHIPLKTDRWDVAIPGFTEIDLGAHCGSFGDGEFVHSLNVTDIDTTWVETAAVLGKSQLAVQTALDGLRQALPSRLGADRLRQRLGVHQPAPVGLLPGAGDPVHPRAPLQEG